jgi:hypothetical protein
MQASKLREQRLHSSSQRLLPKVQPTRPGSSTSMRLLPMPTRRLTMPATTSSGMRSSMRATLEWRAHLRLEALASSSTRHQRQGPGRPSHTRSIRRRMRSTRQGSHTGAARSSSRGLLADRSVIMLACLGRAVKVAAEAH